MGGQVADHGQILMLQKRRRQWQMFKSTKMDNHFILLKFLSSCLEPRSHLLAIDTNRRHRVMKNHTATHLLHALFTISLVTTQPKQISQRRIFALTYPLPSQLLKNCGYWNNKLNEKIWEGSQSKQFETDIDTVKEMGAMALFGEKYGKEVRVNTIGDYLLSSVILT